MGCAYDGTINQTGGVDMDVEQLKMVIDMISGMGEQAKGAFIWWLIITQAQAYIFGLIWSAIGLLVIIKTPKLIKMCWNDSVTTQRLREAADVGYCFSNRELDKACAVLKQHYRTFKKD